MHSKPVFVDQAVSVLEMLRLDDTDNILISRLDAIWKYHDMLLARLAKSDKRDVTIHLRPQLLNADVDRYVPYLADGVQITLWNSDPLSLVRMQDNLKIITLNNDTQPRPEGFLVIRTPTSSRVLAAWQDEHHNIVGVLVTNFDTVDRVSERLDTIVRIAAD